MMDFRNIAALAAAARRGDVRVADIVEEVLDALALARRPEAWLALAGADALRERAAELDARRGEADAPPLYGVPFAVKDNIDAAGFATTAGCPAFAYRPAGDATAVRLLLDAGAILVGKTHMDQFATGLVGTRSPHGPCRNAYAKDRISGGSSSGSAVAVAEGIVAFSLGTDTAGSGRVPAALGGIVGLKPTRGLVSTKGVVPACASLDCVSVFAASCEDAAGVLRVLGQYDGDDPWSRRRPATHTAPPASVEGLRVGVPCRLPGVVGDEARRLFADAMDRFSSMGARVVEIDYEPFAEAAELLYGGGWTAERDAAFGDFLRSHAAAVDPTVAAIVTGGAAPDGRRVFEAQRRLQALRRETEAAWEAVDVLAVPTVPEPFRIADVLAEPLGASRACGATNNFLNLLDLAGCTVPTGAWDCGVPFGVTLCAPAWSEELLLSAGARLHEAARGVVPRLERPSRLAIAVVGAHLSGMPLHGQLAERGARLVATTRTAAEYALFALAETTPAKPGLKHVGRGGASIEVEVYALAPAEFASFVAAVPRPLAIGRIRLEDGSEVSGFVCEPAGLDGAEDITAWGSWRKWCGRGESEAAPLSRVRAGTER